MATGDQKWTKLAIGAAVAVKMGAVYVDIKQTQAFFEEGFEGNPKLVKFVFAMTDDGTALRESTIAQNNFWIATYLTAVNVTMTSVLVLVVPTVKRAPSPALAAAHRRRRRPPPRARCSCRSTRRHTRRSARRASLSAERRRTTSC